MRRADGNYFEYRDVCNEDPRHAWSVLDDGEGGMGTGAGFHVVNMLGYLKTKRPWVIGAEYAPFDMPESDDADDEDEPSEAA